MPWAREFLKRRALLHAQSRLVDELLSRVIAAETEASILQLEGLQYGNLALE